MKSMPNRDPLPRGYEFIGRSDIDPRDALHLWYCASGSFGKYCNEAAASEWQQMTHDSMFVLGIRSAVGDLVGMGTLDGDEEVGWLRNLAVHPKHQKKGLARALISERINLADIKSVGLLQVELSTRNRLKSFYEELGFVAVWPPNGKKLEREKATQDLPTSLQETGAVALGVLATNP